MSAVLTNDQKIDLRFQALTLAKGSLDEAALIYAWIADLPPDADQHPIAIGRLSVAKVLAASGRAFDRRDADAAMRFIVGGWDD